MTGEGAGVESSEARELATLSMLREEMQDRKGLCREEEGSAGGGQPEPRQEGGEAGQHLQETAVPKVNLNKNTVMGSRPSSQRVAPGRANN